MYHLATKLVGTAALVMGACGCGPHPGPKMDPLPLESRESLVYLDTALTAAIPCEDLSAERMPSGRLHVYARFYNTQNHTAETQIKLKFRNGRGRTIDETSWTPFLLARRQSTQFEHTSLTDKAEDFVLMLRMIKQ